MTFKAFYNLILGEFDFFHDLFEKNTSFEIQLVIFAIFLISTLISIIMMLNLLITVISDVFAKVESKEKVLRNFERLQIISSIDVTLRGEVKNKLEEEFKNAYLFIISKKSSSEEINRTKQMRGAIEKIEENVNFLNIFQFFFYILNY